MFAKTDFQEEELAQDIEKLTQYSNDSASLHAQVGKFFVEFDTDKSGFLDRKELRHFMQAFFKEYHIRVPLNDDFVHHLFNQIDENHDNKISPEELEKFSVVFVSDLLG
jgi:Ca2+-binding EF-hand superfamily protein